MSNHFTLLTNVKIVNLFHTLRYAYVETEINKRNDEVGRLNGIGINSDLIKKVLKNLLDLVSNNNLIPQSGSVIIHWYYNVDVAGAQVQSQLGLDEVYFNNQVDWNALLDTLTLDSFNKAAEKNTASYDVLGFVGVRIIIIDRSLGTVNLNNIYHFNRGNPIGWCEERMGRKVWTEDGHILFSAKGENGSCFWNACSRALGQNGIEWRANYYQNKWKDSGLASVRTVEGAVSIADCKRIAELFNLEITVFCWVGGIQREFGTYGTNNDLKRKIIICYWKEHWYSYIGLAVEEQAKVVKKRYCDTCKDMYANLEKHKLTCKIWECPTCGHTIQEKNKTHHRCNMGRTNFTNRIKLDSMREHGKNVLFANVEIKDTPPDFSDIITFDFECYPNENKEHTAYALGCLFRDEINIFYDLGCEETFLNYLDELEDTGKPIYLIGYNNARYDNFIIEKALIKRRVANKMVLHDAGGIISLIFKGKKGCEFRVVDCFRYLGAGSLKTNCKDFKIETQKGDFPHRFIAENRDPYYRGRIPDRHYWDELPPDYGEFLFPEEGEFVPRLWDLELECKKYLRLDLLCTFNLFKTIANVVYENFHVYLNQYLTVSHLSYNLWLLHFAPNVNTKTSSKWYLETEKPDMKNFTKIHVPSRDVTFFTKLGITGGRCYNTIHHWVHPQKEEILKHKDNPEKMKQIYEAMETGYIKNFDVCSLYGAAMINGDYPVGQEHEMSNRDLIHLNENPSAMKHGIYEIKYIPPKNLVIPILPRKDYKMTATGKLTHDGVKWDLEPSQGVYSSVYIRMALEHGYKVEFLRGIYWNKTEKIFKTYVSRLFELKAKAEREKNEAGRNMFKLLANALYGKMLQGENLDETKVITNLNEASTFFNEHKLKDIITFEWEARDKKEYAAIFKGEKYNVEKAITKCNYLGVFILDFSKQIVTKFDNTMCPDRLNPDRSLTLQQRDCFLDTDTDSFFQIIYEDTWEKVNKFGFSPDGSTVGYVCDDLRKKGEGKIIEMISLGPKKRYLCFLRKDGTFNKDNEILKCKGIPQRCLVREMYVDLLEFGGLTEIPISSIKRVPAKQNDDLQPFSIYNAEFTRSFGGVSEHRKFTSKLESVPFGFDMSIVDNEDANLLINLIE